MILLSGIEPPGETLCVVELPTAAVALPLKAVEPPEQIVASEPALTEVGPGFTVMFLVAVVVPQLPPLVVKVSVTVPDSFNPAV